MAWVRDRESGLRDGTIGRDTVVIPGDGGSSFVAWGENSGETVTRIYVARLDSEGAEEWRSMITGNRESAPRALVRRAGEILLAGTAGLGGSFGFLTGLSEDTGARPWDGLIGDSVDDIALAPDGSIVAVGFFRDSITVGGTTLVSAGSRDIFLVRYAADRTVAQAHSFGDRFADLRARVSVDPTGNIYISGWTGAGLSLGGSPLGTSNTYFVGSLTASGAHRWSMPLDWVTVYDLEATADALFIFGGASDSTFIGGIPVPPGMFVVALDSDGVALWATGLGLAGTRGEPGSLAVDEDTVYVTAGFSGELVVGDSRLRDMTGRTVALAALDRRAGIGRWAVRIGGDSDAFAHSIASFATGLVISGVFTGRVEFGGESLVAFRNVFFARYDH